MRGVVLGGWAWSAANAQSLDAGRRVPTAAALRMASPTDTIRAAHPAPATAGAFRINGLLDEPAWRDATPVTEFTQRDPAEGAPATERTEVRVVAAGDVLYIGVKAFDTEPDKVVARILARDKIMEPEFDGRPKFAGDDAIAIVLDPFHDHRNAFLFATNANGAEFDALITDEGKEFNIDWRGVWTVAAQRTPDGWSAEFAIPFRTLRYRAGGGTWGFNVFRMIRRKNEEALWQSWHRGNEGIARVSRAGHLEGLTELPRPGRSVDLKPYVLGGGDHKEAVVTGAGITNTGVGSGGLDLKSEVRPGLVLDLSYNTDFAQVEVDDQQVNLTRFSLFFPEKREFFLENAGIFAFGAQGRFEPPPFLAFFSRRIGIDPDSGAVPLIGGGRLTGRVGNQTVGILSAMTASKYGNPRAAFNVARVKRDVGGNGYVGAMLVDRRDTDVSNTVGGVDFSLWPSAKLNLSGFAAHTSTSGPGGDDVAWRMGADYQGGDLQASLSALQVGKDVEADAGFVTRTDVRRTQSNVRYVLRPTALDLRRVSLNIFTDLVTDLHGVRQDWSISTGTSPTWNSGDNFGLFYNVGRNRVTEAFDLADTVAVPAGDYASNSVTFFGSTGPARPLVLNVNADLRQQFGGTVNSVTTGLSAQAGMHLNFKLGYTRGTADLPNGDFIVHLVSLRSVYAFTTHLTLNSLLQYNSLDRRASANLRLNYIFRPGSDLFLVLNEERGSELDTWAQRSRGVRLKLTYLARL